MSLRKTRSRLRRHAREVCGRPGPKLKKIVAHGLLLSSIGFALISTPFVIKNCSKLGSTKEGSVVVNTLIVLGSVPETAPRSFVGLASPPEDVPFPPNGG